MHGDDGWSKRPEMGGLVPWTGRIAGLLVAVALGAAPAAAQSTPDAGVPPPAEETEDDEQPDAAEQPDDAGLRTPAAMGEPEGAEGTEPPSTEPPSTEPPSTEPPSTVPPQPVSAAPPAESTTATATPPPEPTTPATSTPGTTPNPHQTAATDASRAPRRTARSSRPAGEEAEDEEEDRFRLFYIEASAGYSWINLAVIKQDNFVPEFQTLEGNGFALGGGAGLFLSFLTLGLQAEWANHSGFDVGTVALDVGIRIPTPHVEPYIRAGIGYAWLFNLEAVDPMTGENIWSGDVPHIRGVAIDAGLGFDIMLTNFLALGLGVDVAIFNVRRSGVSGYRPMVGMVVLEEDGDAVGIQVSALAQLNFHF